jgi:SpoVK/Ycf46/Vps4 family AAA+-type ATPase
MEEDDEWEGYPAVAEPEDDWAECPEPFPPRHPHRFGISSWAVRFGSKRYREREVMTDKLSKLLNMPHSTVLDASASYQISQKFIAENEGDIFYAKVPVMASESNYSLRQIIDKIKEPLTDARAVMPYNEVCVILRGDYGASPVLIWVNINTNRRNGPTSSGIHDLNVEIISHPDAVEAMKKFIGEAFKEEKLAEIKWWTQGQHGDNTREIYLPKSTTKLLPEFYPDLGDPSKYIADYMAADEAVLLIAGPPGTGKTTLLRHMIADHKLSAHVIYDETLMQKDKIFQSFLFDAHGDIMIIEDADTILNSREQDNNKLMSRFLNVSDGLIKLPNKKLVFTTNITDFSKVDPALLRPGRCFGVMHTRALNLSEAQAAAKVGNLPIPTEKREYTIAELFNQGKKAQVRTIGFGARH